MQMLTHALVIFMFFTISVVSCNMKLNLDYLLESVWEHLALLRIYTKKRGGECHEPVLYVVIKVNSVTVTVNRLSG